MLAIPIYANLLFKRSEVQEFIIIFNLYRFNLLFQKRDSVVFQFRKDLEDLFNRVAPDVSFVHIFIAPTATICLVLTPGVGTAFDLRAFAFGEGVIGANKCNSCPLSIIPHNLPEKVRHWDLFDLVVL